MPPSLKRMIVVCTWVVLVSSCQMAGLWAQNRTPVQAVPASTSGTPAKPAATSTGIAQTNVPAPADAPDDVAGIQALMALLNNLDPYPPVAPLSGKVEVYGSTAMDNMAHAWIDEFKLFHPGVSVQVSAAGSGDAFAKLKENPKAVVMLSRPVKLEELKAITGGSVKDPGAFVVAREALGVFVHTSNDVPSISAEQMRAVFTKATADDQLKWKLLGVTGPKGEQPIQIVSRAETSGTQAFLRDFVFGGMEMRISPITHGSNSDVLGALANEPLGITICGLRASGSGVRALPLVNRGATIASDDATILTGNYPLTRSLTLVVDLGQTDAEAKAAQELVHFAICRTGQMAVIRAGFFPAELSALRAGLSRLDRDRLR